MRLFKEVLIETAEQAEKLPEGSFVRDVRSGFEYRARHALGGYLQADLDAGVEVVALVPIEAEEEWGGSRPDGGAWECPDRSYAESDADGWNRSAGPDAFKSVPVRRFSTPWEPA